MSHAVPIPKYEQEYYYNGRIVIRHNFPLITCWATTIHKVQGLSLKEAALSIGSTIFEKGQAYVALSRVETLANLHLLAFCENKLTCNMDVMNQYLQLYMLNCSDQHNYTIQGLAVLCLWLLIYLHQS